MLYRWIKTKERISGAFTADVGTLGGVKINDRVKFPRGWLEGATPQELADLSIETYDPPEPPVPPAPGTNEYALQNPLSQRAFFAIVQTLGLEDAINSAIDAMPDSTLEETMRKNIARNWFYRSNRYNRNDPMFESIGPTVGLTPEEIDAAWAQAVSLDEYA